MPRDGCKECSRRRIKCDKGTPECAKCLKKGIKCTGVGRQIRFVEGAISKGKRKGHTFSNRRNFATGLSQHLGGASGPGPYSEAQRDTQAQTIEQITFVDSPIVTVGNVERENTDGDVEEIERLPRPRQDYTSLDDSTTISFQIDPGADLRLELLKPGIQMLFHHCKSIICPLFAYLPGI